MPKQPQAEPPRSSPSITTDDPSNSSHSLTGQEIVYLANLPQVLNEQLTTAEAVMLVRTPPRQWTPALKAKMRPWADDQLRLEISAPTR